MFDTICTLPLTADLFALALHPTEPILTVGLSSGHVYSYRLPSSDSTLESDDASPPLPTNGPHPPTTNGTLNGGRRSSLSHARRSSSASENGLGSISTLWHTRRHKGSCRTLKYTLDGRSCLSAGTDGIIKTFDTETGRVTAKHSIALTSTGAIDGPTVIEVVGDNGLLLATDSGKLELRDTRVDSSTTAPTSNGTQKTVLSGSWCPHGTEHINALLLLPASASSTSGVPKSCVSVGGTTLAVTDFRKGVVSTSEDQDVELTSLTLVDGLKKGGTSVGEKMLVGQGDGVVSLWERGVWGDLDERVIVDKYGAAVESLAELPSGLGGGKINTNEKIVAVGLEDGRVRFVRIGRNGVLGEWDVKHDDVEGVVGLGFDVEGRLVSGGGEAVKVWTEAVGGPGGGRAESGDGAIHNGRGSKRSLDQDSDDDVEEDEDEDDELLLDNGVDEDASSDEERNTSKRKKRKRNKGKDKSGGLALSFSGVL